MMEEHVPRGRRMLLRRRELREAGISEDEVRQTLYDEGLIGPRLEERQAKKEEERSADDEEFLDDSIRELRTEKVEQPRGVSTHREMYCTSCQRKRMIPNLDVERVTFEMCRYLGAGECPVCRKRVTRFITKKDVLELLPKAKKVRRRA